MPDYKKMYGILCRAIDKVIDPLAGIPQAKRYAESLQEAMLEAEELYIETSADDENGAEARETERRTDSGAGE